MGSGLGICRRLQTEWHPLGPLGAGGMSDFRARMYPTLFPGDKASMESNTGPHRIGCAPPGCWVRAAPANGIAQGLPGIRKELRHHPERICSSSPRDLMWLLSKRLLPTSYSWSCNVSPHVYLSIFRVSEPTLLYLVTKCVHVLSLCLGAL